MSDFDYDKIKDMEYDPDRECYVGKNGEEFHVKPYSNGTGYKYDYYDKSPYGNEPHNSTHIKSDLNENWSRTDNDRDNDTQEKSSGSGCYLTSACMKHFYQKFDDNCYELTVLRWFRDNFVSEDDVVHYYEVAPIIVENLDNDEDANTIYNYIYDNVVNYCVKKIEQEEYDKAYARYKNSVIFLEEEYARPVLHNKLIKVLKKKI